MIKKTLNQNTKYVRQLIKIVEPNFNFGSKPINRFDLDKNAQVETSLDKSKKLKNLEERINAIENCKLKDFSKNLVMGDGNINSPIMIIGENPGELEDIDNTPFLGEAGALLDKMLLAINIKRKKIYTTYSINFRSPEDRKPTSQEIKRYSIFLKDHISIIDPKIIILLGSTAMEALTGLTNKISDERGKWKEIIIKNKSFIVMISFSPSYLIRFPENKKYSWIDLKKIRQKVEKLKIEI
tara:strand:- start:16 stop:735 length:720 start_codon:yes stop_codon:yes gene_type:complete